MKETKGLNVQLVIFLTNITGWELALLILFYESKQSCL